MLLFVILPVAVWQSLHVVLYISYISVFYLLCRRKAYSWVCAVLSDTIIWEVYAWRPYVVDQNFHIAMYRLFLYSCFESVNMFCGCSVWTLCVKSSSKESWKLLMCY